MCEFKIPAVSPQAGGIQVAVEFPDAGQLDLGKGLPRLQAISVGLAAPSAGLPVIAGMPELSVDIPGIGLSSPERASGLGFKIASLPPVQLPASSLPPVPSPLPSFDVPCPL